MMKIRTFFAFAFALLLIDIGLSQGLRLSAQVAQGPTTPVVIGVTYPLTAISATAALNAQTTLTIPAPAAGLYNYVCTLHFNLSQNATGSAATNAVTTSTNFNSYAIKFSTPVVVNGSYDFIEAWGIANAGCPKSTSPGTATTFVSPAGVTNSAYTWTATYYQAP